VANFNSRDDQSRTMIPWDDNEVIAFPAKKIVKVDIVHEVGVDFAGNTITRNQFVQPSETPTVVSVSSTVIATPSQQMNSPEYLAAVRRRKAARIRTAITRLEKRASRDDFGAFTFKVVEDIRELLIQLAEVHREGNTREILRQIRDTFLDGGHEQYKKPHVRILIASILQKLAEADEVTPEDVDQAWDELYDNEIRTAIPAVMVVETQEEASNA
jgi:hypothetical protein